MKKVAVTCKNQAELSYMNEWLLAHGMTEAWIGKKKKFPIYVTTDGCWLDRSDRAIEYTTFEDFVTTDQE